jgi:hypothetical protein
MWLAVQTPSNYRESLNGVNEIWKKWEADVVDSRSACKITVQRVRQVDSELIWPAALDMVAPAGPMMALSIDNGP